MNNQCKQVVIELAKYYSRSVNDYMLKFWCGKLTFYENQDLRNGADHCMTSEWRFPTLEKFLEYVDRARNKRLDRLRGDKRSKEQPLFQANPKLGRDCWDVMQKVLNYRGDPKKKTQYNLELVEELNIKHGGFNDYVQELREKLHRESGTHHHTTPVEVFDIDFEGLMIKGESHE